MSSSLRYATIVADPPWHYGEGWPGLSSSPNTAYRAVGEPCLGQRKPIPYPTMALDEIAALPVDDLAERNAHLYLWTTNRYLREAYGIAEAWRFKPSQVLVWAKTPMGIGVGGTFATNAEFILFCRRGTLSALQRLDTCWWNWPRAGKAHSRKPEAFLDMVEAVSPSPRLEMFARRNRLGWDTWGNESLAHVEVAS